MRDASERCDVGNERFKMGDGRPGARDGKSGNKDEGWEMGEDETQDRWNGIRNERCEMKDER